jgi:hypothetical protein
MLKEKDYLWFRGEDIDYGENLRKIQRVRGVAIIVKRIFYEMEISHRPIRNLKVCLYKSMEELEIM